MTVLAATALATALLGAGALVLLAVIVAGRLVRAVTDARRAAGAATGRRLLLAVVAGDAGPDELAELAALTPAAWRALEPSAVALLDKVRGATRDALVPVFEQRGTGDRALRDLARRGRLRRATSAQILGRLGRADAVPALCLRLSDPGGEVRIAAVRALGDIGDPAAATALVESLTGPDPVPAWLVADTLVRIGPQTGAGLVAALGHDNPLVRLSAVDVLGLIGAVQAATALGGVLTGDGATEVRGHAATALGRLGVPGALAPLTTALARDPEPAVRAAAAEALGRLGDEAAVPALVERLGADVDRVASRGARADAAGRAGDRGAADRGGRRPGAAPAGAGRRRRARQGGAGTVRGPGPAPPHARVTATSVGQRGRS